MNALEALESPVIDSVICDGRETHLTIEIPLSMVT